MGRPPDIADSPMMQQWAALKRAHNDCVILFRMGDFYEAFNDDAGVLARVCDVALTSRPVKKGSRTPMAGVPYHAADGYITRLVRAGHRVAIVEQVGAAGAAKRAGMSPRTATASVEGSPAGKLEPREVVRIVTPGTLLEGDALDAEANNYLAAVVWGDGAHGLAHADLTTGHFATTTVDSGDGGIIDELLRLRPSEVVFAEDSAAEAGRIEAAANALEVGSPLWTSAPSWRADPGNARRELMEHFAVASLAAFGCENQPLAAAAAGLLLGYLTDTQRGAVRQIGGLATYATGSFMGIDAATRRNLEITATLRGGKGKGTLVAAVDRTVTAGGGRLLRRRLEAPLTARDAIDARLDSVGYMLDAVDLRVRIRNALRSVPDLERMINRAVAGYSGPREMVTLAAGLRAGAAVQALLQGADHLPGGLAALFREGDPWSAAEWVTAALADDPPSGASEPGVIRRGYDATLDELHAGIAEAREWIAALEERERSRSGIRNLKVGYNRVFGYYLEVPKAAADKVPADYHRKQTVTSGERYITPDLKEREAQVTAADELIGEREWVLFVALRDRVAACAPAVLTAAADIARLDVATGLAETAAAQRYVRPGLDDSTSLDISAGRHPVVEQTRPDRPFVPNDVRLGEGEILVLTGPNMAGKSTVLRQVALIALLAQAGSFVPAESARLGIVDSLFTRIGAQDEIALGQSTFMVEMVETARILHHATPRSLIIVDELGRGTSTYDGMAIAWAVLEYLHDSPRLGARSLFATHFHELTGLADRYSRVRNAHMEVTETTDGIAFLHRIAGGPADRSYGVHVAELAGLPRAVTARAWELLDRLEREGQAPLQGAVRRPSPAASGQLPLLAPTPLAHPALAALQGLDLDRLTPLEALNKLAELVASLEDRER